MIRADRKTACPILDRIEKRYSLPHWIFLRELRNDTGFQSTRSCDALAVGLYHSRGQLLIGFEKKISRSDWLRELKDPAKAEAIFQFCDQWYVIVPDAGIVQLDEMPPTWGLLHAKGNTLRTLRPAPMLTPRPIDRGMMASIIQRAIERALVPYLISDEKKNRNALDEAFDRGKNSAASELVDAAQLKVQVKAFEEASGLQINRWSGGRELGNAVRAVMHHEGALNDAARAVSQALYQLQEHTIPALERYSRDLKTEGKRP